MIDFELDKITKGIVSGLLGNILNITQKIIFVPIFIKYLGTDTYSTWLQLLSIVSFFSLLDLGSSQAIIGTLQKNLGNKFRVEKKVLSYIIFFFLFPAIIFFLILLVLIFNIGFLEKFFLISRTYYSVFIILLFHTIISITLSILINFYASINFFYKSNLIANFYLFLQLVLSALLLLFNFGIFAISVSYLAQSIIFILIILNNIAKNYKINFFNFQKFDFIEIKKIVRKSVHFICLNLYNLLSSQGFILIFSVLSNSINLIIYSSLKTLTSFLAQLTSLLFSSIWFNISKLYKHQSKLKFNKFFIIFFQISNFNSLFSGLLLAYFGQSVIIIWIGNQFIFSNFFLHLIISSMITNNMILTLIYYFQARYKLHLISLSLIFYGIAKVILFYFVFKISNADNSFLLQILLDIFFILYLLSRIYFENLSKFFLKTIFNDILILNIFIVLILFDSILVYFVFLFYIIRVSINLKYENYKNS